MGKRSRIQGNGIDRREMKTLKEYREATDKAWGTFKKAEQAYHKAWEAYMDAKELKEEHD